MTKKSRSYSVLCLLVALLLIGGACGGAGDGFSDEETTINQHGRVTNPEARQRFLAAYSSGAPARWMQSTYNVEGDPIYHKLVYEGHGKDLRLSYDTMKDRFGPKRVVEYRCSGVNEGPKSIDVMNCVGSGQQTTVSIPK